MYGADSLVVVTAESEKMLGSIKLDKGSVLGRRKVRIFLMAGTRFGLDSNMKHVHA